MVIKLTKEVIKTYADFEKAVLQMGMIMGNKKVFSSKVDKESLSKFSKEDLIKRIGSDSLTIEEAKTNCKALSDIVHQLNGQIEGWKVLCEKQKRTIEYYKADLTESHEVRISLAVGMDMGLQE